MKVQIFCFYGVYFLQKKGVFLKLYLILILTLILTLTAMLQARIRQRVEDLKKKDEWRNDDENFGKVCLLLLLLLLLCSSFVRPYSLLLSSFLPLISVTNPSFFLDKFMFLEPSSERSCYWGYVRATESDTTIRKHQRVLFNPDLINFHDKLFDGKPYKHWEKK